MGKLSAGLESATRGRTITVMAGRGWGVGIAERPILFELDCGWKVRNA